MHFSTLTFGFNGGSCGQPSSLEGGELRGTTKMPAGNTGPRNRSQKLISISKILGLQKYRLFLHYSTHNFPDEMGEFIPGAVEKVAMRAGILIQAKAHN